MLRWLAAIELAMMVSSVLATSVQPLDASQETEPQFVAEGAAANDKATVSAAAEANRDVPQASMHRWANIQKQLAKAKQIQKKSARTVAVANSIVKRDQQKLNQQAAAAGVAVQTLHDAQVGAPGRQGLGEPSPATTRAKRLKIAHAHITSALQSHTDARGMSTAALKRAHDAVGKAAMATKKKQNAVVKKAKSTKAPAVKVKAVKAPAAKAKKKKAAATSQKATHAAAAEKRVKMAKQVQVTKKNAKAAERAAKKAPHASKEKNRKAERAVKVGKKRMKTAVRAAKKATNASMKKKKKAEKAEKAAAQEKMEQVRWDKKPLHERVRHWASTVRRAKKEAKEALKMKKAAEEQNPEHEHKMKQIMVEKIKKGLQTAAARPHSVQMLQETATSTTASHTSIIAEQASEVALKAYKWEQKNKDLHFASHLKAYKKNRLLARKKAYKQLRTVEIYHKHESHEQESMKMKASEQKRATWEIAAKAYNYVDRKGGDNT